MNHSLALRDADLESVGDRRSFLLLRWLLILAVASLFLASHLYQPGSGVATLVMATFALSNVGLHLFWSRIDTVKGFDSLVAVLDTFFVSLSIFLSGIPPIELFVLSLLLVFL